MKTLIKQAYTFAILFALSISSLQGGSQYAMQQQISGKAYKLIDKNRVRELNNLLGAEKNLASDIQALLIHAIEKGSPRSILLLLWPDASHNKTVKELQTIMRCISPKYHRKAWSHVCEYLCQSSDEWYKEWAINVLCNAHVDINARNACDETLLYEKIGLLFINLPGRAAAQLLLAAGADPNVRDSEGESPLHLATRLFDKNLILLLLQHGAEVNQPDYTGVTSLYIAAFQGWEDIVELLLQSGATASRTTINIAHMNGHRKVAQQLEAWQKAHKVDLPTYVARKLELSVPIKGTISSNPISEEALEAAEATMEKMLQMIEGKHTLKKFVPEIARRCRHTNNLAATRVALDTLVEKLQETDPLLQRDIPMVRNWPCWSKRNRTNNH